MSTAILKLHQVNKFFGSKGVGVHAVKDLNMDIHQGEIIALLGSSGCGKTSTLRMIAGFEEVSSGTITLMGRDIHTLPPVRRNVAMAFEGYALYPPLTVRDNIGFALKSSAEALSRDEIAKKTDDIAQMLQIEDILGRYPSSISSGQQQRVSLARALIRRADIYVLDEPMGQLEPQLRALLRGRIKHYIKQKNLTAILVTHDQTEANALADRIAVMEDGYLQQFDTAEQIKKFPYNLFTGTFMGEPPMNVFEVTARMKDDTLLLYFNDTLYISYNADAFSPAVLDTLLKHQKVMIGVRPYAIHRVKSKGIKTQVIANQWLGDQSHIVTNFADKTLVMVEHDRTDIVVGSTIHVDLAPQDLHIFDIKSGDAIAHGSQLAS